MFHSAIAQNKIKKKLNMVFNKFSRCFTRQRGNKIRCWVTASIRLIPLGSRSDAGKRNLCISFCFQVDSELNTSATVFSLTNARSSSQSPESNKLCPLNWHWANMPPPASLRVCLITLAASFFCIPPPCLPNVCFCLRPVSEADAEGLGTTIFPTHPTHPFC
jgi:hypothetical protein